MKQVMAADSAPRHIIENEDRRMPDTVIGIIDFVQYGEVVVMVVSV